MEYTSERFNPQKEYGYKFKVAENINPGDRTVNIILWGQDKLVGLSLSSGGVGLYVADNDYYRAASTADKSVNIPMVFMPN